MSDVDIFGYYERADQTEASYDPGVGVPCPFCLRKLSEPLRTVSLMLPGDSRSYFYRAHRGCHENAGEQEITEFESALIDHRRKLMERKQ